MKRILTVPLAIALLILGVSACSTSGTSLYNVWSAQDRSADEGSYRDLLIIGLAESPENRRKLEDSFVASLSDHEADATASLDIMTASTPVDKESVLQALEGMTTDAVLVVKVVNVDESEFMKSKTGVRSWEEGGFERGMEYFTTHDDYFSINPELNMEGLTTTSMAVTMKVGVYDLQSDRFVWTADSQSRDPKSAEGVIDQLVPAVIAGLQDNNLI